MCVCMVYVTYTVTHCCTVVYREILKENRNVRYIDANNEHNIRKDYMDMYFIFKNRKPVSILYRQGSRIYFFSSTAHKTFDPFILVTRTCKLDKVILL